MEDANIGERECTHVMNEVTLRCKCSVSIAVVIQWAPGEKNQEKTVVYSKSKAPPPIRPQAQRQEQGTHRTREKSKEKLEEKRKEHKTGIRWKSTRQHKG